MSEFDGPTDEDVDFFAERYLAVLAERDALSSELAVLRDGAVPVPGLDAIKARADAATLGPWCADGDAVLAGDDGSRLAAFNAQPDEVEWPADITEVAIVADRTLPGTAEFIAHARSDVPALIVEVRRLSSELAGVRVELERTEGDWAVAIREATRARAALEEARAEVETLDRLAAERYRDARAARCEVDEHGQRIEAAIEWGREHAQEIEVLSLFRALRVIADPAVAALSVAATDTEETP